MLSRLAAFEPIARYRRVCDQYIDSTLKIQERRFPLEICHFLPTAFYSPGSTSFLLEDRGGVGIIKFQCPSLSLPARHLLCLNRSLAAQAALKFASIRVVFPPDLCTAFQPQSPKSALSPPFFSEPLYCADLVRNFFVWNLR